MRLNVVWVDVIGPLKKKNKTGVKGLLINAIYTNVKAIRSFKPKHAIRLVSQWSIRRRLLRKNSILSNKICRFLWVSGLPYPVCFSKPSSLPGCRPSVAQGTSRGCSSSLYPTSILKCIASELLANAKSSVFCHLHYGSLKSLLQGRLWGC